MELIFREGRSERRRRIYGDVPPEMRGQIEGVARNAEEAADLAYHQHGEQGQPYLVAQGPERKQAFIDDMKRIGQDPDRVQFEWEKGGIKLPDAQA